MRSYTSQTQCQSVPPMQCAIWQTMSTMDQLGFTASLKLICKSCSRIPCSPPGSDALTLQIPGCGTFKCTY